MKKFLLFVSVLFMSLAFIACDSDVLTSFQDDITAVEADIDTLTSDLADLETEVNALGADLDAAETGISDLESDLSTINTTIGTIQASITAIEANIDTIEGNIATAQAKGDANAADIAALEADVADLETSLATLEASLLAIETAFNAFVDSQDLLDSWASTLTTDVVLMYNNDVHGRVEEDSWNKSIGFATIKNLIDVIRSSYDNTFLVSAGDMFHGTTFATLEEGESFVDVMNAVGYDLMVPGNHDFDYGQDQLLVLEGLADFPLISSNIQYSADDSDMFDPYFIQTFGNIEVGFFGLTTPDTTYMTHPNNVIGLNFLDPIAQAQEMVDALEAEEVDIIVCLAHIGLDESSSITTEDLALAVDGIDLIIDGHSHSYLPQGNMVNDTIIVSASEYNKNFGVLKMTVEDGKIIAFHNNLINYTEAAALDYGEDEDVQALIDAIILAQEPILNEVVGQTAVELDGLRDHVRAGETNLGKIITDAMITATGADIAITNGGGIRASIEAGEVTIGDIITVLPFGNIIVTLNVTGQDIIDSLEHGVSGLPGTAGRFPHVAGITFTVDLNNATGSRVTNVMVGGVPIDPLAIYSVATNDFMAAGGDDYVLFITSEKTGEFMGLHEALEAAFTVGVDIVIPSDTRITIIQPSS